MSPGRLWEGKVFDSPSWALSFISKSLHLFFRICWVLIDWFFLFNLSRLLLVSTRLWRSCFWKEPSKLSRSIQSEKKTSKYNILYSIVLHPLWWSYCFSDLISFSIRLYGFLAALRLALLHKTLGNQETSMPFYVLVLWYDSFLLN